MNQIDADYFIENDLKPRFPDWLPTVVELSDYYYALRRFDSDTAKHAAREHRLSSSWKQPKIKDLIALCHKLEPKHERRDNKFVSTVFVQYQGGGDTSLRAGYFFPIIARKLKYKDWEDDQDRLKNIAHDIKTKMFKQYSGSWEVIIDSTVDDMLKARFKLAS